MSTTDLILILGALILVILTISVIVGALLPPRRIEARARPSDAHRLRPRLPHRA